MISLIGYLLGMNPVGNTLLKKSGMYPAKDVCSMNTSKKNRGYAEKPKLNRKVLKCDKK